MQDLKESLYNLTLANGKLLSEKYILEKNDEKNKSAINDLRDTFNKARVIFRSEEREIRFNSAIASEIANLKASTGTAPTQKYSQRLVLQGIDLNTQSSTSFDDDKEYSSYVV